MGLARGVLQMLGHAGPPGDSAWVCAYAFATSVQRLGGREGRGEEVTDTDTAVSALAMAVATSTLRASGQTSE
eukprot:1599145-Rhodomonas_salina.2